jgi:hypothetical protein
MQAQELRQADGEVRREDGEEDQGRGVEQVRAAAGARAACPQRPQLPLRLRRRLGNIHALVSASAAWRGSASGSGIQLYEELDLVDSSSLF